MATMDDLIPKNRRRVQIKTAYAMWRGGTNTKMPHWDELPDQTREAITGTVYAFNRMTAEKLD